MQRRSALALLLCALVGGAAAAFHDEAHISGKREKHEAFVTRMFKNNGMMASATTPTAIPAECLSVAEVAKKDGNFSILLAAAEVSGFVPALSDRALHATVFAPTDDALKALLEELHITVEELLAEPLALQAILKYHVVTGAALTSKQLRDGMELSTLLADDIEAEAEAAAAAEAESASSAMGMMKKQWAKMMKAVKEEEEEEESEDGVLIVEIQKVYGLKPPSADKRITVVASLSEAEVVVADVNAGCPAVVHVIDNVLLPDLE